MLDRTRKRVGYGREIEVGMREEEYKGRRNEESINQITPAEFFTKSCMVAYEW